MDEFFGVREAVYGSLYNLLLNDKNYLSKIGTQEKRETMISSYLNGIFYNTDINDEFYEKCKKTIREKKEELGAEFHEFIKKWELYIDNLQKMQKNNSEQIFILKLLGIDGK